MRFLGSGSCSRFAVSSALIIVGSGVTVPAQQPMVKETVVVTATVAPESLGNVGRSLEIISGDEVRRLPIASLADALRLVAGIEVRSRGPLGVQSDFSIRGAAFGQMLVLVNGMRLNDAQSAHHNSDIPVPLEEIERIEILPGRWVVPSWRRCDGRDDEHHHPARWTSAPRRCVGGPTRPRGGFCDNWTRSRSRGSRSLGLARSFRRIHARAGSRCEARALSGDALAIHDRDAWICRQEVRRQRLLRPGAVA